MDAGFLRSGVGDTAQEAIASALKLALREIDQPLNAVEIRHIELTNYPWFTLARVGIHPYRIQQSATLSLLNAPGARSSDPQRVRSPRPSKALLPQYASAMPQLRQMLISSRGLENPSV
jgi:hypothetical protein